MPKTSGRLLALLSLLQTRRDWPGTLLAERLDISLRTVRRDIDRLRELGYPIAAVKGPDGGYRLSAGTELPPLLFDDEQAVALTIALQIAATTLGDGTGEAAARALTTIRQVMPSRLRHRINALQITAVERPATRAAAPIDDAVLLVISSAVQAREILRFDYRSDTTGQPRRVEPYHVITWDGRWYLVAWDLDRSDWRTFRADRMALRIPNGPRFVPRELPGGDVTAFVTGRFRGADDGNLGWPCQGTVMLDLPAATVARYTRDGIVEEVDSHRCRLTLGSWSWPSLAAAIARFDTEIEVVDPAELFDAFGQLARRFGRTAAGPTRS
ncbi:Predicted DNA-binding transcriptional regulator YafY, contains an HTH and WYL domains [Micromonospora phaseoli]|uniref:Predicted DNA-binding transcriptional regulator YafY, contains an HTH and WYL domains n=1 Tax=Micromonospora phaseoli TaxID=1144548 RepID=A0A1H7DX60_9ACTN|nr:YafY family protein [Micromonospora phaseoli]PZV88405.1 putative DNA-binding transcriptional regulator YafY [Micromonospora phaseoli]SEK06148.1 Predicted DNA-binding transcriptional regulator YafY, contains an HTH and WYL domains [Micromonospora phaseoli]